MSRSWRKPWIVDGYGSKWKKWQKRQASKAVRRSKVLQEGKWYKKIYCSWNICDHRWYEGNEAWDSWWTSMKFWQWFRK